MDLINRAKNARLIKAIRAAKKLGIQTHAIVAFDGGECLKIADIVIHFKIDDMQIAEDTQLIVGHIVMQWLASRS